MSLSKLMKEEGKRSKSASPKPTPIPDSGVGKVEKRKQEDGEDEELSKRARLSEVTPNDILADECVNGSADMANPSADTNSTAFESIVGREQAEPKSETPLFDTTGSSDPVSSDPVQVKLEPETSLL
jgi:hypothetical protein